MMKSTYRAGWFLAGLCLPSYIYAQSNPSTLVWRPLNGPNNPFPDLRDQASAYDSSRRVEVFFGGEDFNGQTNDTYEWNGLEWNPRRTDPAPPARARAAMTYDNVRGVCVLFGGLSGTSPLMDLWERDADGSRWTLRQPHDPTSVGGQPRPSPAGAPMMVFDTARRKVVLVSHSNTTWEWDGTGWTEHTNAPPARSASALIYDPIRRVTMMFGGVNSSYHYLNDTWTWDGTTWRQVATGGPSPRTHHSMTFDMRRGVTTLFGGAGPADAQQFSDTWEWNGQSWSLQAEAARFGLNSREGSTMWYDVNEQKLVLFGGLHHEEVNPSSYLDDLWEARPPGYWVDFGYAGWPLPESGYFHEPFNTLAEAVLNANSGGTINLKAGSSAAAMTISKPLSLEAFYGSATVGRP